MSVGFLRLLRSHKNMLTNIPIRKKNFKRNNLISSKAQPPNKFKIDAESKSEVKKISYTPDISPKSQKHLQNSGSKLICGR